jgi:hypothetical protein
VGSGEALNHCFLTPVRLTVSKLFNQLYKNGKFSESVCVCIALGGLLVSVLATGRKVRGFKLGRGRRILRVIKSAARLPSDGK